jgi:hypothetical protein
MALKLLKGLFKKLSGPVEKMIFSRAGEENRKNGKTS